MPSSATTASSSNSKLSNRHHQTGVTSFRDHRRRKHDGDWDTSDEERDNNVVYRNARDVDLHHEDVSEMSRCLPRNDNLAVGLFTDKAGWLA